MKSYKASILAGCKSSLVALFCCSSDCLQSWVTPAKGSLACGKHNEGCVWCFILLTGSLLICRCTGFIFQKVGKLAATAVGGGFFLLQVCMNSSPGFLGTVLLGTKVSLGTTACWDMWGQSPPPPGALCGCECQKCVFSRAHGCDSKAGSVCINSRSASADPLRICYQRPGQRHRRAVIAGAPEWSMRQPSAAVNLAAAAAGLANILKYVVSLEEQPWMSRRIYPYL